MSDAITKTDLGELNESLDQIDQRFERVDRRFEHIDKRFERVDDKLEALDKKIDKKIENAVDELTALLRVFMAQVDERFNRLEEEPHRIRNDINRLFDYMDQIANDRKFPMKNA